MIDDETGYIKLAEFSETSDRELGAALEQLTAKGMKRLVFDLRDNPGGLLDQAILISNRFLPQGDLIVYQRGRVPNSERGLPRRPNAATTPRCRCVVLVNRNSASASEIVSGALQDHDRALVVGETTFGKALVQSVYRIADDAGVARHDRPLLHAERPPDPASVGRQLRRVPHVRAARPERAARRASEADLKYTDGGRKVYGGGGIEPDKFLAGPVEGFSRPGSAASSTPGSCSPSSPTSSRPRATRAWPPRTRTRRRSRRGFTVTDEMVARLPQAAGDAEDQDRRGGLRPGRDVHPRDDPLRHRRARCSASRRPGGTWSRGIRRRSSRCSSSTRRRPPGRAGVHGRAPRNSKGRPVGLWPHILGLEFALAPRIGAC